MKTRKILRKATEIFSKLFLVATVVFVILTVFTEKSYTWFSIGSFVLCLILAITSNCIDTRTPEEKARDAEVDTKRKAEEDAEEADKQERLNKAKTEYNGNLCETCNAGMSLCDQCGNYSQWR